MIWTYLLSVVTVLACIAFGAYLEARSYRRDLRILQAIREGAHFGMDLKRARVVPAHSCYVILHRLENEGWLSSTKEHPQADGYGRRLYTLTARGHLLVAAYHDRPRQPSASPYRRDDPMDQLN